MNVVFDAWPLLLLLFVLLHGFMADADDASADYFTLLLAMCSFVVLRGREPGRGAGYGRHC